MSSQRQTLRIALIACFAVLMAALAPSVSRILAGPAAAAVHCADEPGSLPDSYCGYCVIQADLPHLPTLLAAVPAAWRPNVLPGLALRVARLHALLWPGARPRAPPLA